MKIYCAFEDVGNRHLHMWLMRMYIPITFKIKNNLKIYINVKVYTLSVSNGKYVRLSVLEAMPPAWKNSCPVIFT